MRHASPRSPLTRGRAVVAVASGLIVAVSLLSAIGVIPVPDTSGTLVVTAGSPQVGERSHNVADRDLSREQEPLPAPSPTRTVAGKNVPDKESTPDAPDPTASKSGEPTPGTAGPVWDRPLPADSGTGRRVVFSITDQHVWLVTRSGAVKRNYPVSGSKFDQLEPGTYDVIRKRRHTTSYHGTESMEYMVTFTFGDNAAIGFHDIPKRLANGRKVQTKQQLGRPLSDGCVRQWPDDAAALWKFAPKDTPVIVLP